MKRLLLALLLLAGIGFGDSVRVGFSKSTAAVDGAVQIGTTPLFVRAGGVHIKDNDNFGYIGISTKGPLVGYPNLEVALLVDFVHSQNRNALPLGIGFTYLYPYAFLPLFIRGYYEYAPNITTFGEAHRFSRWEVDLGIQPIANGELFVGYRSISWDSNFNSTYLVGMGFLF
jgi:hypothetical protein